MWRTVLGIFLIVIGLIWAVMAVLGTSMMSRSVDVVSEMLLPAGIGALIALGGLYCLRR